MNRMFFLIAALMIFSNHCYSKDYPASISFLVADFKYNEIDGVKICEVQTLSVSRFKAYDYLYGGGQILGERMDEIVKRHFDLCWFINSAVCDPYINIKLIEEGWRVQSSARKVEKDPDFRKASKQAVYDPYDLTHYHGLFYLPKNRVRDFYRFKSEHPGVIYVDEPVFPFSRDKYKMSILFNKNESLQSYKPRWKLYPKKYTHSLAQTILNDLKCDIVVIKPRGASLGNGVILVDKEDLDKTLELIINRDERLKNHPDYAYRHWMDDNYDDFIVEQFIESTHMRVSHLGNRVFDPTMRVMFSVFSHRNSVSVEFIGGYIKLPKLSLNEQGTLNETHKTPSGESHHYMEFPPDLEAEIHSEITRCMTLLYQQMF